MQRVQIDLSAQERQALQVLAQRSGRSQSSLIREAIDGYLEREQPHQRLAQLRQARGLWAGRDDLPDWPQLRQELDRHATFPC
jgi:predicted transcriptional regulator